MPFLIQEMETGALDGWYTGRTMAHAALRYLSELYPAGRWTLLELINELDGTWRIPDDRFWTNVLADPRRSKRKQPHRSSRGD